MALSLRRGGRLAAQLDATPFDQQPEDQRDFTDKGQRGDLRCQAQGKYRGHAVKQVAETGDGNEDAQPLRNR
jgi:hypothetical protein